MAENKKKTILFYSSVNSVHLFKLTGFYVQDIKALISAEFRVISTNNMFDFFLFWKYDISFLYFYKKSIIPAIISKLFFKNIYFTGGIDEISNVISLTKINQVKYEILFKICYILSTKCNIVSKTDFINTKNILNNLPKIHSSKLSLFPHCIEVNNPISFDITKKENTLTTICWMGSVDNVKRKGLERCLNLMIELIKYLPNFKLIIIGTLGEGSNYLKNLIYDLSLSNHVVFTGEINDTEKFYLLNNSKYYLQLSKYEGFGVAVLEAMFANCLIFHSNQGGLKETVNDKGIIFSNFNDYNQLAKKIVEIDKNYINYINLIKKNKEFIIHNYTIMSRSNYFKNIINA